MSVVYSLYDALVSINVPEDKAKADLAAFRVEFTGELKLIRQEMSAMSNSISKDLQIQMAAVTALISAIQYFH